MIVAKYYKQYSPKMQFLGGLVGLVEHFCFVFNYFSAIQVHFLPIALEHIILSFHPTLNTLRNQMIK